MSTARNLADELPITVAPAPTDAADVEGKQRAPLSRSVYGDMVQFVDFVTVTAASVFVAYIYHAIFLASPFDFQRYAAAGLVGATCLTALLRRDGLYDFKSLLKAWKALRAVIARWALVILGLIAFGFALKVSEDFSRAWLFAWAGASTVLLFSIRLAAGVWLRKAATEDGMFARRIAIIGDTCVARRFAELAKTADSAVSIVGIFRAGPEDPRTVDTEIASCGDLRALERAAQAGAIDDVVIAMPTASEAQMRGLVLRLSSLPVSIAVCANAQWLEHKGGEVAHIGNAPVLTLFRRPLDGWGGVLKTVEDRVLGGVLFLFALPILLAVAAAIRLQGKGPIFFRQQRHGFNHQVFKIYKFRTMTVAEDGDAVRQATQDDDRITPVGRFLRRYSIDELPQLLNVLKGEMSLVGPRPHALAHNHQYAQAIQNYSGRHKVKPGITGWAQVNGCRGETSETEMMAERVRYDLEYIDNWSLLFDIKILVMTVAAVLFPKNAY